MLKKILVITSVSLLLLIWLVTSMRLDIGTYDLPHWSKKIELNYGQNTVLIKGIIPDEDDDSKYQVVFNRNASERQIKSQIDLLLSALTIPDEELWIDLSPDNKISVLSPEMLDSPIGEIFLKSDYLLKQYSSSEFIDNVLDETGEIASKKIWIEPGDVELYRYKTGVYIEDSTLKIRSEIKNTVHSQAIKSIESGVNKSNEFAPLRQLFNAVVLAQWLKTEYPDRFEGFCNTNSLTNLSNDNYTLKKLVYKNYTSSYFNGIAQTQRSGNTVRSSFVGGVMMAGAYDGTAGEINSINANNITVDMNVNLSSFSSSIKVVEPVAFANSSEKDFWITDVPQKNLWEFWRNGMVFNKDNQLITIDNKRYGYKSHELNVGVNMQDYVNNWYNNLVKIMKYVGDGQIKTFLLPSKLLQTQNNSISNTFYSLSDPRFLVSLEQQDIANAKNKENIAVKYIRNYATKVKALHDAGIVHNNINSKSLVTDYDSNLYLGGFEYMTEINSSKSNILKGRDKRYLSLRQKQKLNALPADDVYSLITTLYHALVGEEKFNNSFSYTADGDYKLDMKKVRSSLNSTKGISRSMEHFLYDSLSMGANAFSSVDDLLQSLTLYKNLYIAKNKKAKRYEGRFLDFGKVAQVNSTESFMRSAWYFNNLITDREITLYDIVKIYEFFSDKINGFDNSYVRNYSEENHRDQMAATGKGLEDFRHEFNSKMQKTHGIYMDDFISFINTIFEEDVDVIDIAASMYSMMTNSQIFQLDGNHRLAWYVMNYILIRNGYDAFYFESSAEYDALLKDHQIYDIGQVYIEEFVPMVRSRVKKVRKAEVPYSSLRKSKRMKKKKRQNVAQQGKGKVNSTFSSKELNAYVEQMKTVGGYDLFHSNSELKQLSNIAEQEFIDHIKSNYKKSKIASLLVTGQNSTNSIRSTLRDSYSKINRYVANPLLGDSAEQNHIDGPLEVNSFSDSLFDLLYMPFIDFFALNKKHSWAEADRLLKLNGTLAVSYLKDKSNALRNFDKQLKFYRKTTHDITELKKCLLRDDYLSVEAWNDQMKYSDDFEDVMVWFKQYNWGAIKADKFIEELDKILNERSQISEFLAKKDIASIVFDQDHIDRMAQLYGFDVEIKENTDVITVFMTRNSSSAVDMVEQDLYGGIDLRQSSELNGYSYKSKQVKSIVNYTIEI